MDSQNNLYHDLNTYFKNLYGHRVHKITLDSGLTCPNRDGKISFGGCIYCNAQGSGTGNFHRGLSITQQIESGKKALALRYKAKKFMAYFQSFTNTYGPLEYLKSIYGEALACEDIIGLSIGTRPDCVDEPVLSLLQSLAENHLIWVEYGLQSAKDETLARINRGHDVDCFIRAVEKTRNRNLQICAHVILGLPGETDQDMLEAARLIGELGLDGVKLHLLYVVRNTPMETLYRTGGYACLTRKKYVEIVCDFLERLPPDTVIHRLTGDPHADELVAPAWALGKSETLNLIQRTLAQRDSRQGKHFRENRRESLKSLED
jgi:hypothetical protein